MEHIVQFAIGIDDDRITQAVENNAEKEIIKQIKQSVVNRLFSNTYYCQNANPQSDNLSAFSKKIVTELFAENRDAIINRAAEILADKLAKSKAGKAILEDMKAGGPDA